MTVSIAPKYCTILSPNSIAEGAVYQDVIDVEPAQAPGIYGPLLLEQALSGVPIFGSDDDSVEKIIKRTLDGHSSAHSLQTARTLNSVIPPGAVQGKKIGEKLRALRELLIQTGDSGDDGIAEAMAKASLSESGPASCRELHENLLSILPRAKNLPPDAQSDIDNAMLLRAKERYLFDSSVNRSVVSDDLWLRYIWDWIAGSSSRVDQLMSLHC